MHISCLKKKGRAFTPALKDEVFRRRLATPRLRAAIGPPEERRRIHLRLRRLQALPRPRFVISQPDEEQLAVARLQIRRQRIHARVQILFAIVRPDRMRLPEAEIIPERRARRCPLLLAVRSELRLRVKQRKSLSTHAGSIATFVFSTRRWRVLNEIERIFGNRVIVPQRPSFLLVAKLRLSPGPTLPILARSAPGTPRCRGARTLGATRLHPSRGDFEQGWQIFSPQSSACAAAGDIAGRHDWRFKILKK